VIGAIPALSLHSVISEVFDKQMLTKIAFLCSLGGMIIYARTHQFKRLTFFRNVPSNQEIVSKIQKIYHNRLLINYSQRASSLNRGLASLIRLNGPSMQS
jgi:hypothetical protein